MPLGDRISAGRSAAPRAPGRGMSLAAVALSAVLVRIAASLLLNHLGLTTPQNEHWDHARSLYAGSGFGFDWYGLFPGPVVGSFVPPLYAGILSGFLHLTGGADRAAMILAQILNATLGGATAWLVGSLAARMPCFAAAPDSLRGPRLAALAWALYPPAVGQAAVTNTAVMEGFVLVALAALLAAAAGEASEPSRLRFPRVSIRFAVAAGLLLGAGLLQRPTFALIWLAWVALLLLPRRRRSSPAVKTLLLATAVAGVAVLPWTIRNLRVHGALVPIATNGGFNFAIGNDPRYGGGIPPLEKIFRRLPAAEQDRLRSLTEIERDRAFYAEGLAHWRETPGPLLKGAAKKALAYLFFRPYLLQGFPPWIAAVFIASYAALLGGFVAGFRRAAGPIRDLSVTAVALTGLLSLLYVVSMRYRASVEPLIAVVAAAVLARRRS